MHKLSALVVTGTSLAIAALASAQVQTGAPKGSTALCKDGTFYTGDDQAKACQRNGGVQEWWGKVATPKEVPEAGAREPYDKAVHPKPAVPPAGGGNK